MSTKTMQGQLWSIAPAYWSQHFEPWFLPMYREVMKQLQLTKSDSLLDAGCGSGLFSSMAIATGAQVTGVDAAPGLLEIARQRNPGHNFLEEDLEFLPFAANSFDVVTAFNSLQYAGSFEKALAETARVLTPGGKLVIGIWDKPANSDATEVLKSIGSLLPPPPPGTPGPFALSEEGRIETALSHAGLKLVYNATVPCPFVHAGIGNAIKCFMGTGPAALALNQHSRETVEHTVTNALQRFRQADDFYFLQNHFLVFIAEKK